MPLNPILKRTVLFCIAFLTASVAIIALGMVMNVTLHNEDLRYAFLAVAFLLGVVAFIGVIAMEPPDST